MADREVVQVNRLDGVKMILEDGSWLLLRPSGTEPVVVCTPKPPPRNGSRRLSPQGKT